MRYIQIVRSVYKNLYELCRDDNVTNVAQNVLHCITQVVHVYCVSGRVIYFFCIQTNGWNALNAFRYCWCFYERLKGHTRCTLSFYCHIQPVKKEQTI